MINNHFKNKTVDFGQRHDLYIYITVTATLERALASVGEWPLGFIIIIVINW